MRFLIVLAAALVLAAPVGSASRRAELFVNALDTRPGATAETDIELSLPASAASVAVYVPAGYTLDLDRRPGTAIGSVTVTTLRSRTTADLFTTAAGWQGGGLRIAVDRNTFTFSPPADARDVDLDLRGVLVNPAAPSILTWRAIVTPTSGAPFEVRSIVAVPQVLILNYAGKRLTGRLLFAGKPRPGVNVHFVTATRDDLSDQRELGAAATRADGRYSFSVRTPRHKAVIFVASVNFYVAACRSPCVEESIAPPPARIVATGA